MASYLGKLRNLPGLRELNRIHHKSSRGWADLPGPWDVMTGRERWEAIQYAKGNLDPYHLFPQRRGPGTKDCPNVVPSIFNKRIVGCICHEDALHVVWWWLHEGYPRRCKCNYWFILERIPEPKLYEDC